MPKKKKKKQTSKACRVVICEGPDGRIVIAPNGDCPPGYMKRIHDRAKAEGGFQVYAQPVPGAKPLSSDDE